VFALKIEYLTRAICDPTQPMLREALESLFKYCGIIAKTYNLSNCVCYGFELVHRSNMSKLGENGLPVQNDVGKVIKGPNYKAADMKPALLLR